VDRHHELFVSHPDAEYTFSAYHTFDESNIDAPLKKIEVPTHPPGDILRKLLLTRNFICGVSVIARRACYQKTGPFDEALYRSQDYDMWIRLARHFHGYPIVESTVQVREHSGARGSRVDRFNADEMGKKQHHYHRLVFSKVYREISLEQIFGELANPTDLVNALVERIWMMAKRLLVEEVDKDLDHIRRIFESGSGMKLTPVACSCFTFLASVFKEKGQSERSGAFDDVVARFATNSFSLEKPIGAAIWDSAEVSFKQQGHATTR
jgi:hypothetical protein